MEQQNRLTCWRSHSYQAEHNSDLIDTLSLGAPCTFKDLRANDTDQSKKQGRTEGRARGKEEGRWILDFQ